MKKLLFRKFISDTTKFFIIICLAISLIVWVIQAVGFLDIVIEDGHSFKVYFYYSLLNFPKIIHRILPFVFFIALFYQLSQYERRNELLIFWTNGIKKITFINAMLFYSFLIMLIQIFLGGYISPIGQNEARSYIRGSNIDFFPSLMKEGKFIDTVSDLTIFIESKDKFGSYSNIFLYESSENSKTKSTEKSQMIYAKKGTLINEANSRYFQLRDGKMINSDAGRITTVEFEKIDFNLSKYTSKTITYPKIQEAPSIDLFKCLLYSIEEKIEKFKAKYLKCEKGFLKNIKQEFLKRFYKPIYFPLITLISCLLILKSKESVRYNNFKFFLFLIIFLILVISEISLRYSTLNTIGMLFFIFFPIISFLTIYTILLSKFRTKT
ncbi:LptF/LptG family permease [Candidatus Pelagibacter sp.]|nr:LptF/LptG family permease [Candidatus Pelagibacter sp.]